MALIEAVINRDGEAGPVILGNGCPVCIAVVLSNIIASDLMHRAELLGGEPMSHLRGAAEMRRAI